MESESQPESYEKTGAAAMDPPDSAARDAPRLATGQRWVALGLGVGALAAMAWLGLNNPLEHSFLPRCPTEQFAGVYCPGCGATRATHHMLQGRPVVAMGYNPLLVILGTPLILWTLVSLGYQAATGRRVRRWQMPGYVGWGALVVLVGFAVLRNLPGEAFEGLRPTPVEVDRARARGAE
ncbi:DUF2752 domain-containing protein [Phycisphaeraceae bacterium D3-23]